MKLNRLLQFIFGFVLLFSISCTSDYEEIIPEINYNNGFLITNEGNFGTPNADVTFVTKDLSLMQNDIYKTKNNNENLGDVLQTMTFNNDKAYLLLNSSNRITVVDRVTFKKTGEITAQLNNPRYMAVANGNLYVTNDQFGAGKFVNVYKLSDNSFVKKIDFATTSTVEGIVEAGGNIYVQNTNAFNPGTTLTKINTSTNTIDSQIQVPNGNNINKIISYNNSVYAITEGAPNSYIHQIPASGAAITTTTLTGIEKATNLQIDGGRFYFSSKNKIYSMAMNATTSPTSPLITAVDGGDYFTLYGFSVIDGRIFTVDVKGFTAASEITVYTTAGTAISKFTAGMGANGIYKNY
ncbi:YncE family protein [Chryseobacterium sp. 2TAF14]|uniref:YncE family protein n=1 Tax=Chryseobacterium sp. 2TAF14 TaxID=3233007 RepID=UPI003F92AFE7